MALLEVEYRFFLPLHLGSLAFAGYIIYITISLLSLSISRAFSRLFHVSFGATRDALLTLDSIASEFVLTLSGFRSTIDFF